MSKIEFPSYSIQSVIERWQSLYKNNSTINNISAAAPELGFKPLPNGSFHSFIKSSFLYQIIILIEKDGMEFTKIANQIFLQPPDPEFLKNEIFLPTSIFYRFYDYFGRTDDVIPLWQEARDVAIQNFQLSPFNATRAAKIYVENIKYLKGLQPLRPCKIHKADKEYTVSLLFNPDQTKDQVTQKILQLIEDHKWETISASPPQT